MTLMNNKSHGTTFFQVKVVMKIGLMYLTYYGNEPQVGNLGVGRFLSKEHGRNKWQSFLDKFLGKFVGNETLEMTLIMFDIFSLAADARRS